MNPRKLTRADLVKFAANAAERLAAGVVEGLPADMALDLAILLTDANEELSTAVEDLVALRAASRAGTATANEKELAVVNILNDIKLSMGSVNSPEDEYDALGFDPPAARQPVNANAPTELSAAGLSNGVTELRFKGNNVPGTVNYIIEANSEGRFYIIGTTRRQRFVHHDAVPGQPTLYRVYAVSARLGRSAYSNEAAIYKS
jgi:hypothetical protein